VEQQQQADLEEEEKELQVAIEFSKQLVEQQRKIERIRSEKLPEEPKMGGVHVIRFIARLPTGENFERDFNSSDTIRDIRNFVEKQSLEENGEAPVPENFRLVTDFPRQVWDDLNLKLEQIPFRKRFLVRVEPY